MYIDTSSGHHGNGVFVCFERNDIIQFTITTFYYNRISILAIDPVKTKGRFKIHLLLADNTWKTPHNVPENDQYSVSSWMKLSLKFTVENYDFKLIYYQIDTPHADMCFSSFKISHSV